jgi:hypothetical protein
MTSKSRKVLRNKRAQKRTDHAAGCRVSDTERNRVLADIDELTKLGGIEPSLGAYTKHALLSHGRLRRMEAGIRDLYERATKVAETHAKDVEARQDEPGAGGYAGGPFILRSLQDVLGELSALLESAR